MRLIERHMSLALFNFFGAGRPVARSVGMVLATVSRWFERHQTALWGPTPGPSGPAVVAPKRDASETSPCRRGGHSKRTARSPEGVTIPAGDPRGNREPPSLVAPARRPHRLR